MESFSSPHTLMMSWDPEDAIEVESRPSFHGAWTTSLPPEYVDVTESLFASLKDLQEGQMVALPSFTLEQSMAAIQIADPRMDIGIYPPPDNLVPETDKVADSDVNCPLAFDPAADLSAVDICWIMDRALACEAAWHQGATLQQTIHTCLYIYQTARIHPRAPGPIPPLISKVVRPYIIALLKSIGLAWDELIKDHVADLEDFSAEKAGVSLLEEVPPQEAIRGLDEAIAFLEVNVEEQIGREQVSLSLRERRSLVERLLLRKHILALFYTFALATNSPMILPPHDSPMFPSVGASSVDALHTLGRLTSQDTSSTEDIKDCLGLMSPALKDAPSRKAMSAFDPNHSRRLAVKGDSSSTSSISNDRMAGTMPPPHPVLLAVPTETSTFWRRAITDMEEAYRFHSAFGWRTWKTFLTSRALRFQRWPRCAYVRSLFQSIICTGHVLNLSRSLDDLSDDFMQSLAGMPIDVLKRLTEEAHEQELRQMQAARQQTQQPFSDQRSAMEVTSQLAWFLGRLPGHLVEHLNILCQTRARSHRNLCKSYGGLVRLSEEAGALGDKINRLLRARPRVAGKASPQFDSNVFRAALQALILDVVIQVVMAGFEVELLRSEEYAAIYWVASWAASERHVVLNALAEEAQSCSYTDEARHELASSLADQAATMEMLEKAFRGMFELCFSFPRSTKVDYPWLPDEQDMHLFQGIDTPVETTRSRLESVAFLERDTFFQRFSWLSAASSSSGDESSRGSEIEHLWASFVHESARTRSSSRSSTTRAAQYLHQAALLCDDLHQAASEHEAFLHGLRETLEQISQRCQASQKFNPSQLKFKDSPHPWFPLIDDDDDDDDIKASQAS